MNVKEDGFHTYKVFLSSPVEKQEKQLREKPASWWEGEGAKKALATFHAAAERVPAYKDFLNKHKVNPAKITSLQDFQSYVPVITKKDYLKTYSLADLCWDGKLEQMNVISVSSGSTGQPFLWPRDIWQEREVDHLYELTLRYLFEAHRQHSLIIIAFAMGMYIAGPFTFASCLRIAQKGYPLALCTPGSDIEDACRVIRSLSDKFKQIIMGGYPPLVKEIIDACTKKGFNWKAKSTKLFFGGEGFSEEWRDYVHALIGAKSDFNTTINMYGTADSAILGIETPVSIAFRRVAVNHKSFLFSVFHSERLPSVLSYNPLLKYFEESSDRSLLLTSSSGIPLVRYKIGDVGGIISYKVVLEYLKKEDKQLQGFFGKKSLPIWRLPLVYLFGRDDFTVHLSGANVYPENIKEALEDKRVRHLVTGKFILATNHRRDMSPYLDIRVELVAGVGPNRDIKTVLKKIIVDTLRSRNSEYEVILNAFKKKAEPEIKLAPYGSKDFRIKIKHPWTSLLGR